MSNFLPPSYPAFQGYRGCVSFHSLSNIKLKESNFSEAVVAF